MPSILGRKVSVTMAMRSGRSESKTGEGSAAAEGDEYCGSCKLYLQVTCGRICALSTRSL